MHLHTIRKERDSHQQNVMCCESGKAAATVACLTITSMLGALTALTLLLIKINHADMSNYEQYKSERDVNVLLIGSGEKAFERPFCPGDLQQSCHFYHMEEGGGRTTALLNFSFYDAIVVGGGGGGREVKSKSGGKALWGRFIGDPSQLDPQTAGMSQREFGAKLERNVTLLSKRKHENITP